MSVDFQDSGIQHEGFKVKTRITQHATSYPYKEYIFSLYEIFFSSSWNLTLYSCDGLDILNLYQIYPNDGVNAKKLELNDGKW